jgi:hypothetical protein
MALTAQQITATSLGSGPGVNGTTIYTSTGSNAITSIIACNNSGSTINLSLYAVPNGKNAYNNPECVIVCALPVPAGETLSLDQEKLVLGNNDVLCAIASSAYSGTGIGVVVSTLAV